MTSVTFSPTGRFLASGSYDKTVQLWNIATGIDFLVLWHDDFVTSVAVSSNGAVLAAATRSGGFFLGEIKLWSVPGGWELLAIPYPSHIYCITFSPEGEVLASGSYYNTIRLWDVATGRSLRVWTGHTKWVVCIAFSPQGDLLVYGPFDGTVRLWDVSDLAGQ